MLKSQASRVVLVIVLGIAVFELGITHKFGEIWSLAFQGTPGATSGPAKPPGATTPAPTIPPVVIA